MRLIDADALDIYDVSPAYGMTVMGTTEEDIWLAPTVDAVPVEFIEKEINMTKKGGADMYPHCLTVMLNRWKRAERKEE